MGFRYYYKLRRAVLLRLVDPDSQYVVRESVSQGSLLRTGSRPKLVLKALAELKHLGLVEQEQTTRHWLATTKAFDAFQAVKQGLSLVRVAA
jgi:DNA-binding IclR family transcriptional regulator